MIGRYPLSSMMIQHYFAEKNFVPGWEGLGGGEVRWGVGVGVGVFSKFKDWYKPINRGF